MEPGADGQSYPCSVALAMLISRASFLCFLLGTMWKTPLFLLLYIHLVCEHSRALEMAALLQCA